MAVINKKSLIMILLSFIFVVTGCGSESEVSTNEIEQIQDVKSVSSIKQFGGSCDTIGSHVLSGNVTVDNIDMFGDGVIVSYNIGGRNYIGGVDGLENQIIDSILNIDNENEVVKYLRGGKEYIHFNGFNSIGYKSIFDFKVLEGKVFIAGETENGVELYLNDQSLGNFLSIHNLNVFDEENYGFIVKKGKNSVLYLNGKQTKITGVDSFGYSKDGKLYYTLVNGKSTAYYFDNKLVGNFSFVGNIGSGKNGNEFIGIQGNDIIKVVGNKSSIIKSGNKLKYYDIVDGKLVYSLENDTGTYNLFYGDESLGSINSVNSIIISDSKESFSYIDIIDNKSYIYKDGELMGSFLYVDDLKYVGEDIYYVGNRDGVKNYYKNNETVGEQSGARDFVSSSDGSVVVASVTEGAKTWVEINGKKQKEYKSISDIIISNDGSNVAYLAKGTKGSIIVKNGIESDNFDFIDNLRLVDGDVAYSFAKDGKVFDVVCD